MTICPVCEHQQAQGDSCDQCGKVFIKARPIPAPAAMPELEQTSYSGARSDAGVERMPDLESTAFRAPAQVAPEPMPDFESTRTAPVEVDISSAAVPDLDTGRAVSDGVTT